MKKVLAMLLATVMLLSMAVGCSNVEGRPNQTQPPNQTQLPGETQGVETTATTGPDGRTYAAEQVSALCTMARFLP